MVERVGSASEAARAPPCLVDAPPATLVGREELPGERLEAGGGVVGGGRVCIRGRRLSVVAS